jgi:hypothetical protein
MVTENFVDNQLTCPRCNDEFTSFNAKYSTVLHSSRAQTRKMVLQKEFELPPTADISQDPVRHHQNLAKSGAGEKFVGVALTTCKDGKVDVKSATYNIDQDCNDYDQRQLHVIESLGLMLNTLLITNDNQRTDKQRIASEGFSRALGSHLRTQRGLFDVSTMFLPQRGIWWSTGNSGRICLVIEV